MPRNYRMEENDIAAEKKPITISETEQVTKERVVTVEELKVQHAAILQKIEYYESLADEIVDMIEEAETNLGLQIANKPARIRR